MSRSEDIENPNPLDQALLNVVADEDDILGLGVQANRTPTNPNTFFKWAAAFTLLGTASFATGTAVLFHEHLNQRRFGVYILSDILLCMGAVVFAPMAMFALHKGFSALKNNTRAAAAHTFGAHLHNDTNSDDFKKPLCNLASRVFKTSAALTALTGLAVSSYAVIDENMRMHQQIDRDVSNYTKELLVLGGVFVGISVLLGVLAATQKIWELKNPGFNVPEHQFDKDRQSLARRLCVDPTPLPAPSLSCCRKG